MDRYDEIVSCTVCFKELSKTHYKLDKLSHLTNLKNLINFRNLTNFHTYGIT